MRRRANLARCVLAALLVVVGTGAAARGYEQSSHAQAVHPPLGGEGMVGEVLGRGLLEVGVGLFEPWVMCDATGRLIGHEVDVARKIADDMGVHIRFVRTDWYYIIPALIQGEFDLIASGMGITPPRGLYVNFSTPYSEFGTAVVANTARTADLTTPEDFDSPDVVFGARAGTVPAQAVADHFPAAVLRTFDTDSALLQALADGELHAAAVDQVKAARWLDARGDVLHRPFDELFNKVPEAFALRKGDADGVNFLNGWIAHHRSNGWLAERRHYWFETRDWADRVSSDPATVAQCNASFRPDPY